MKQNTFKTIASLFVIGLSIFTITILSNQIFSNLNTSNQGAAVFKTSDKVSVDLRGNANDDRYIYGTQGQSFNLVWNSENSLECSAYPADFYNNPESTNTSGSMIITPPLGTTQYEIECTNDSGSRNNSRDNDFVTFIIEETTIQPTNTGELSGTPFGETPFYGGNEINSYKSAYDNNTSTFYDYAYANGGIAGLNLGNSYNLTQIKYHPRAGYAGRMEGGQFQVSSDGTNYNTIYTITSTPSYAYQTLNLTDVNNVQYIRYVSPSGSYGNIAELEVYGTQGEGGSNRSSYDILSTANSAGGNCGYYETVAANSNITLTATPQQGYQFSRWEGLGWTLNSTSNLLTLTPQDYLRWDTESDSSYIELNCYFEPVEPTTYTVTFNTTTGGTISGDTTQTVEAGGETTVVTAVPNSGYEFVSWSGDIDTTTSPTIYIPNINSNATITANFRALPQEEYNVFYRQYGGGFTSVNDFLSIDQQANPSVGLNETTSISIPSSAPADNFGLVMQTNIDVPTSGTYTFYLTSDDGSQLFINNDLAINNDGNHGTKTETVTLNLTSGQNIPITVAYYEASGAQTLKLEYSGPSIIKQTIPNSITAEPVYGCIDPIANNTDPSATHNNATDCAYDATTYTVTFNTTTGGTIEGDTSQTLETGQTTTAVTAVPNSGYQFTGWTGAYTGTQNPLSITTTNTNVTITANFQSVVIEPTEIVVPQDQMFGEEPAYSNGSEYYRAFDNDTSTFYDYINADGGIAGLNLNNSYNLTQIKYYPRAGRESRMVGGQFQVSSDGTNYNTIYTITSTPTNSYQTLNLNDVNGISHIRYVAPNGGYGNVAEIKVYGTLGTPPPPKAQCGTDNGTITTTTPTNLCADGHYNSDVIEGDNNYAWVCSLDQISAQTLEDNVSCFANKDIVVEPGFGIPITYSVSGTKNISIGVYDQNNRMVRAIYYGKPHTSGNYTVYWDGLDRYGNPQTIGTYTAKVLQSSGLKSEFIANLGINPSTNSYDLWPGDHDPNSVVSVDSAGDVYISAAFTETSPLIVKQSMDGTQRRWIRERDIMGPDGTDATQGAVGMSIAGNYIVMVRSDGNIIKLDKSDGDRVRLFKDSEIIRPDFTSTNRFKFQYKHPDGGVSVLDLDSNGNDIVVSSRYSGDNFIKWIDVSDHSTATSVRAIHTVSVDQPRGVAVGPNGEAYVSTGTKIIKVTSTGAKTDIVNSNLVEPQRLSYDTNSNTLLVFDAGTSNQIKRFSLSGQLLNTYGKQGGRTYGTYIPTDFKGVTDVTSDEQGGFFVAEHKNNPRRVAHFDSNGSLINEWYGGQPYYSWAEPSAKDDNPSDTKINVWQHIGDGLMFVELDYNSGDWRILETHNPYGLAGGLIMGMPDHRGQWRSIVNDGVEYIVSEVIPQVLRHENGVLKAVSTVGQSDKENENERFSIAKQIAGKTDNPKSFRWVDSNGDGEPQSNEFTFNYGRNNWENDYPEPKSILDDFTIVGYDRDQKNNAGERYFTITETKPIWGNYGPYYPIGNESGSEVEKVRLLTGNATNPDGRGVASYKDDSGYYYGAYKIRKEYHYDAEWPMWGNVARFFKADSNNNIVFDTARSAVKGGLVDPYIRYGLADTPPGQLHIPVSIEDETNNLIVISDKFETPATIWTKDGLYVGSILEDRVNDGLPNNVYEWWKDPETGENTMVSSDMSTGINIQELPGGDILAFVQGRNSAPVYRINNLGNLSINNKIINLGVIPQKANAIGTGLNAKYYSNENLTSLTNNTTDKQIWFGLDEDDLECSKSYTDDTIHYNHGGDCPNMVIDGYPKVNWLNKINSDFGSRWTGYIEAPITEEYLFTVYKRGKARVWINGKQVLFGWDEAISRHTSEPVRLEAGQKYQVQVDYYYDSSEIGSPALSLMWESTNMDRERIPQQYLYPTDLPVLSVGRDATDKIYFSQFDIQSGQIGISGYSLPVLLRGEKSWGPGVDGSYLGYKNVDFETGNLDKLTFEGKGYTTDKDVRKQHVTLNFKLDSVNGPTIASVTMKSNDMDTYTVDLNQSVTGIHDLYVVTDTVCTDCAKVSFASFQFSDSSNPTQTAAVTQSGQYSKSISLLLTISVLSLISAAYLNRRKKLVKETVEE